MRKKRLVTLIGGICLVFVLAALPFMAACPAPEEVTPTPPEEEKPTPEKFVLKVFAPSPPVMPCGKTYEWMGERLNERTNGRLTIEVYYGGQLPYKTPDCLAVVRDGRVDISDVWDIHVVGTVDWMGVWTLPGLFSSEDEEERINEELLPWMDRHWREDYNCFPIFRTLWTRHDVFSTEEVTSIDDMKGLTLDASGPLDQEMIKELGGIPIFIEWSEMPVALQRGTVVGAVTGIFGAAPMGFLSVCKWCLKTHQTYNRGTGLVNLDSFNALPEDLQTIFLEVAAEAGEYSKQVSEAALAQNLKTAEEEGVTFTILSAADVEKLHAASVRIAEHWLAASGRSAEAKELYNLIIEAKKK